MPRKMPGFYAPDPHNALQRPTDWRYRNTEPWLSMNSDGCWCSWTHEPVYKEEQGEFVYPDLDCSMDRTSINGSYYNLFHFSHDQCRASVYKFDPEEPTKKYCFVCDNYGGTLQACLGCGKGPNSPAALSLGPGPEIEKILKQKPWKHWNHADELYMLGRRSETYSCGNCRYDRAIKLKDNKFTVYLECGYCDNIEELRTVDNSDIDSELLLQIQAYLIRYGQSL